jgi:CDP-diacylglycerol--glycerol-3-phosphate 3-phosphatidyltransferase
MRCDVGLAERAERIILVLVATGFAGLGVDVALPLGLWLLAAASAVTVVQRLVEVRRQSELTAP